MKGRTHVLAGLLAAFLSGALQAQAPPAQAAAALQDTVTEAELKAFFLLTFARITTWPDATAGANPNVFTIGVLGPKAAMEPIEKTLTGRSLGKRTIKLVRGDVPEDLKNCALVFVSDAEKAQIPAVVEAFKGKPVLTVGESEGFAEKGGIVNFFLEENRIRYELNAPELKRAGLVSADLNKLAKKPKDK